VAVVAVVVVATAVAASEEAAEADSATAVAAAIEAEEEEGVTEGTVGALEVTGVAEDSVEASATEAVPQVEDLVKVTEGMAIVAVSVVGALQPATAQIVVVEDLQAAPLATAVVTAVTAVVVLVGAMDEDVGLGSKVGLDLAGQHPDMVPQLTVAAVDMVEVDMAAVPEV